MLKIILLNKESKRGMNIENVKIQFEKIYLTFSDFFLYSIMILLKIFNKNYRPLIFGDFSITDFKYLLPNSPIIVEVGANDGSTTKDFLDIFPDLKAIYCIEPDTRALVDFKKQNFPKEVKIFNLALSDKNEKVFLYESNHKVKKWTYSSSISKPMFHRLFYPNIYFTKKNLVETCTLQTFMDKEEIGHIDLLWLDTQGYELKILKSINPEVISKIDFIYLEYSNVKLYKDSPTLHQIIKVLKYHYLFRLHQNDAIFAKL